jgi:hypothetical protein
MSQQIENKYPSNSSRLPLRKRIAPVLKWQPVETPDENYKPKSYPSPQQYPIFSSSEDYDDDTEERKNKRISKEDLITNRVKALPHLICMCTNLLLFSRLKK